MMFHGHRHLATRSRVFLTPEAELIHLFDADGLRLQVISEPPVYKGPLLL